jgi:hypothetical protein
MTQAERRLKALDPSYVKLDDRQLIDLLRFMSGMAPQINFYNEKNEVDGDWADFFRSDINVLVALITRFDLTGYLARFERLEAKIQVAADSHETLAALRELFVFLGDVSEQLADMSKRLQSGNSYSKTTRELAGLIDGFSDEICQLAEYNRQAKNLFGEGLAVGFPEYGQGKAPDPDTAIFGRSGDTKEQVLPALPFIKSVFHNLRSEYHNFLAVTSNYFKNHAITGQEYHPHLALCIAFLQLYAYLQEQLNALPAQHLDFYYRSILGLRQRGAEPDSVHVVFEPAQRSRINLSQGEELVAETGGSARYYSLDEDVAVTKAQVAELKTLYIDRHIQMAARKQEHKDITEDEVYKKSYINIQPGDFLKQKEAARSWPIFGESQFELADEDRTMEDADIGLLVASPVLYQTAGQRAITLKIYFETASFSQLVNYFSNFAKVTGKQLQAVSFELLSDAFVLSFTAPTAWEEVKRYGVKIDMAENMIEIRFELSPVERPINVYDPLIHGDNYDIQWPVLKLLLNNYSTHNPYSFFRRLVMERITVTADVKGSRAVKLQNNVGNLSADNPFQPFGPQPGVGSYLDVKNTNIFNRFTKDFCIRLEWIDLPNTAGGWNNYYKEYNNPNITNESFRVKLSGLSQGKFKPSPAKRQEFTLFELDRSEMSAGVLNPVSQIEGVDTKKLELPNRPLLNDEALAADTNFNEGAIRIEFSSPQEAFGSRIFPQLLSETALHNAKRFAKQRPMPNPPYIPIVKSITLDYTLEHSEVLLKTSKNDDSALKVIHQYPFGFEALYPESDKQPYSFIPNFEFENNLYIGLRDITPRQDLTLLFQLEDKNYSNTAKEPEPVTWSYLYENSWFRLENGEVLYDTTTNFINSGIVKIRLPEDCIQDNTILPPSLFWLRASSHGQVNLRSKMIGVYTHAVTATRIIEDSGDTSEFRLPADTIKAFRNKIAGINGIYQLLPSYGGAPAETTANYYVRVSERLRHKKRLITNRDIEQAILDEFPQLMMVKSISPELPNPNIYAPAEHTIRIVIVPKALKGSQGVEQPKVNLALLYRIKTFIKTAISPFVDVEVENPVYERIKLLGKIKFRYKKTADDGLYLQKLNADIHRFLCPWQYESGSEFKIGSQIYLAELLNFIKKRPYIDYVTGFSVLHFYSWTDPETGETLHGVEDFGRNNRNYIRGSVPEAVIIPAEQHQLTIISEIEHSDPPVAGIGSLLIGNELLVHHESISADEDQPAPITRTFTDDNEYFSLFINHQIN